MDMATAEVLDYIGARPDGTTVLIGLFPEPWDDSDEQFSYLGTKLRNYADYIMGDKHVKAYPQLAGKPIQILVCGVTRATPVTTRWLAQFALNFSRINVALEYRVVPAGSIKAALEHL